jgi:DNA processing protein
MDADQRREFWATLALRHCKGIGARTLAKLLRLYGSAYGAVEARQRWGDAGLLSASREFAAESWRAAARREWDSARGLEARILLWSDPGYPPLLREIPDAPAVLYCRGDGSLLRAPVFAVVGSRRATAQGKAAAAYMARCLAACGLTIVSGMAQGIDRVAHEAALGQVGRSIGVLGTGIDVRYPAANAPVFAAMEREGVLVSEFPPGTPPMAANFPVRNRIISGLALGVLVAEAASRSGSLVTARLALEQNREVYAVPGPALDAHCLGSQDLVRQGARPVFNAETCCAIWRRGCCPTALVPILCPKLKRRPRQTVLRRRMGQPPRPWLRLRPRGCGQSGGGRPGPFCRGADAPRAPGGGAAGPGGAGRAAAGAFAGARSLAGGRFGPGFGPGPGGPERPSGGAGDAGQGAAAARGAL